MPKTHINDIEVQVFLDAAQRVEVGESISVDPNERERLINDLPIFIQGVVVEIMAQDGYPENVDWDAVTEDGGLSLLGEIS